MGFINAVKGIIEKFRAAGKTENEISNIIETAADKASVNKGHLKKDEFPKPEIKVISSTEAFQRATLERRNTNNWRKMHGLPMRRKQKVRKRNERRKRADCHRQNAHIS